MAKPCSARAAIALLASTTPTASSTGVRVSRRRSAAQSELRPPALAPAPASLLQAGEEAAEGLHLQRREVVLALVLEDVGRRVQEGHVEVVASGERLHEGGHARGGVEQKLRRVGEHLLRVPMQKRNPSREKEIRAGAGEPIFFGCQPSLSGWSTRSPSRALTSQSLRRNSTSIAASFEARDGWEAKAEQTPASSVRKRRAASDERASWRKPLAVRRHCSRRASRACLSFPLSAAHAASFSLSAAEAGGGAGSDAALSPRRTEAGISSCLVCTSASLPSASASRNTAS